MEFLKTMLGKQKKKEVKLPPTVDELRNLLKVSGWTVRELPIRNHNEIVKWRVIARNKDRDFTIEGDDLLAALKSICKLLNIMK